MKRILVLMLAFVLAFSASVDAATISRLHSSRIQNGKPVDATYLNAELNQLVNEHNSKETRLDNIEGGAMTISGNKTFSGTNTHSGSNTFSGAVTFSNTATVSGTLNVTGQANLARSSDPGTLNNGDLWYNSTSHLVKARINGATATVLTGADIPTYIQGPPPEYSSATSIVLKAGLEARDSTNAARITVPTDTTVSITTSGANGLDTGTEASNTWYYIWLIRKSSDGAVAGLLSTSSTSPTMPSGYDQRRLVLEVRNDGSSNFIPFVVGSGWPLRPEVLYDVTMTHYDGSARQAAATNVLLDGTATTDTTVGLSAFVPPTSTMAILDPAIENSTGHFGIGATGGTSYPIIVRSNASSTSSIYAGGTGQLKVRTNTSQQIRYKRMGGASSELNIDVAGYVRSTN